MSGVQWRRSRKKGRLTRAQKIPSIPSIIFIRKMSSSTTGRGTASNYSKAETNFALDCIEQIVPIGSEEWNQVVLLHATKYEKQKRNLQSIRRKFRDLYRMKIPTGNPHCPPEVRRAKRIHALIGKKSEACTGEEDFDLENGFENKENDGDNTLIVEPDLNKSSDTNNSNVLTEIPLGQPSQMTQPSLLAEESLTLYTTPSKSSSIRPYNKKTPNSELVEVLNKAIKTNEDMFKANQDTSKAMMTAVTVLAKQLGDAVNAFATQQQPSSSTKKKRSKKRKTYEIYSSSSDSDSD